MIPSFGRRAIALWGHYGAGPHLASRLSPSQSANHVEVSIETADTFKAVFIDDGGMDGIPGE